MSAKTPIGEGLAAAACALVGLHTATRVEASDVETSVLVYAEQPGRLNVFESTTRLQQEFKGDKLFVANLVIDIMTGASPNGATPSTQPQTFTKASGRGSYTTAPGATPLDPTFQDNRFALDLGLELPLDRVTLLRFGGHGSIEYDYMSFGVNGSLSRDFNKRNTQVTAGFSASRDFLDPEGGPPVPFAPMLPPWTTPNRQSDSKRKTVIDGILGLTQILNRRAAMRVNYSTTYADGYLTDPFKMLSVVDGTPGPNQGLPIEYLYENRPATRLKQSVYGDLRYYVGRGAVQASYRYLWDDWQIASNTVELGYRWELANERFLFPQIRWYRQSAASFFLYSLIDGDPLPTFASADYRLGDFDAYTVSVRYGWNPNGQLVNLRLGYYVQMGDRSPPSAVGIQRSLDLFPTVHALIAEVTYGLPW